MENRTVISYVLLKYDKRTDGIYTKATNNGTFEIPSFEFDPAENETSTDLKMHIIERLKMLDAGIDIDHLFIPFTNLSVSSDYKIYNYLVLVFESDHDVFATMEDESWYRVKYDLESKVWDLSWQSGMEHVSDFQIKDRALNQYAVNNSMTDEIDFCNIMHFVPQETQQFPILGLMSGTEFTQKEVLHYQKLLGFKNNGLKTALAFESKYSDAIRAIDETSYKIKNKYLQK